jgi:hypothetical protein
MVPGRRIGKDDFLTVCHKHRATATPIEKGELLRTTLKKHCFVESQRVEFPESPGFQSVEHKCPTIGGEGRPTISQPTIRGLG